MLKNKDFLYKNVESIQGKRVGFIKDILISFSERKILGFSVVSTNLFSKNKYITKEDIVSIGESIIYSKYNTGNFLKFSEIRGFEVIDSIGNIVGVVEDILIKEEGLDILGLLISMGLIENLIHGKKIILLDDFILGDKSIFLFNSNKDLEFYTKPHFTFIGDEKR
ncbi:PRC-barrel domain-containing protein [Clostridium grantii]|uniref:Uncharacterized protein YrrD, contains PRC-barrel domain n=1 Tax=Clostridium grantii DSM 8605 TaxID=1121316 RepID=A0A1M5QRN6_9CLOT|nr:PRC-barrel domain-containing protein [Clostridium grantii]SHH16419.1 Uncharacterized protein YrrD, contains PRC-barrel domain [Clostridium grantii DSM 8605]